MHGAREFLTALTLVLGVAALTTIVFHWLRQPVVLGYLLAGLIIGPHVPVPVVASPEVVHTLSELGVILLMFGLGLEFSLGKLFRALPTAGVTAVLQASLMMWLGYVSARALGWSSIEALFTGAIIAISSTTIIAKAFDEQGVRGKLRELVVAILIVEDLIAVLLMAALTGVASGSGLGAGELAATVGRLGGFLVLFVALGLVVVPRAIRAIVRIGRTDVTIVATIAVCFGSALLADHAGYSVALGAFVGGVLVAESGETRQLEPLVFPVRDVFGAVFFVSVGMMIDPAMIAEHWVTVLVLALAVVLGKLASVAVGAFLTGAGTRTSIAAGLSLAQIGEFSFIIAGLGVQLGATAPTLYSVAVAVSAITTLTTPWLIRGAAPFGRWVDRALPGPLQTFVGLYEAWIQSAIERLRTRRESRSALRRLGRILAIDLGVLAVLAVGVSLGFADLVALVTDTHVSAATARVVVGGAAVLAALPFCVGVIVTTRRFARRLAEGALPRAAPDQLDLGLAPRKMLETSVLLAGVLVAGLFLVAVTQPFMSGYAGAITLGIAIVALAALAWRKARGLEGHVRAMGQVIVEMLASGTASPSAEHDELLAGLGRVERLVLGPESFGAGRSLADLAVRASTGATVLAIVRDGEPQSPPDAHTPLRAGDVLALAGTEEAVRAAIALLSGGVEPP